MAPKIISFLDSEKAPFLNTFKIHSEQWERSEQMLMDDFRTLTFSSISLLTLSSSVGHSYTFLILVSRKS